MLKRILISEEGRVPDRNVSGWTMEGEKRRVTRKECKRQFEVAGFMARKKGLWSIAKNRMLEEILALTKEDGDSISECNAMHEHNFLSRWLREDVEGIPAEMERVSREGKEEDSRSQEQGSMVLQQTSLFLIVFLGPNLCGDFFAVGSYAEVQSVGQFL